MSGREAAHFEMYSLRSAAGDAVYWRLLSANNRDSGQSASAYPDVDACRSAIDRLLEFLGVLRPLYTLTADRRWHWTLALDDDVLARSSRSFDRRLRCVAANQWFLRAAPNATIRLSVRVARTVALPDPTAGPPNGHSTGSSGWSWRSRA